MGFSNFFGGRNGPHSLARFMARLEWKTFHWNGLHSPGAFHGAFLEKLGIKQRELSQMNLKCVIM
jgi:hypothetical protein